MPRDESRGPEVIYQTDRSKGGFALRPGARLTTQRPSVPSVLRPVPTGLAGPSDGPVQTFEKFFSGHFSPPRRATARPSTVRPRRRFAPAPGPRLVPVLSPVQSSQPVPSSPSPSPNPEPSPDPTLRAPAAAGGTPEKPFTAQANRPRSARIADAPGENVHAPRESCTARANRPRESAPSALVFECSGRRCAPPSPAWPA